MYMNEDTTVQSPPPSPPPLDAKCKVKKLMSLAMTNFLDPTVLRLYKIKSPLKSAASVIFCPSTQNGTSDDPHRSYSLMVADTTAGKILEFGAETGRYRRDLVSNVVARDMTACSPGNLAVVDSNEWGSCVKIVSLETRQVLTTWGRQKHSWRPSAITAINDDQLVVGNIYPKASARLSLFTLDGKQISQFGRAEGPGDRVFRSPLSLANDAISGRIYAADSDVSCIKIFDMRSGYLGEFGACATGTSSAMLSRPVGVCCDSRGNVLVCDSANQRIVLFSADGRYLSTLIDFRPPASSPRRRLSMRQLGDGKVLPVCFRLSIPGSKLATSLEQNGCFRKLVMHSIEPQL